MSADTKKYSIQVGQTFDGMKAAKEYLKGYCVQEKQMFRVRTSGVIQLKVVKKGKSGATHRSLFKCKYGDDVRVRGKGKRETKTCRLGCKAFISTHMDEQTQKVVIADCNLDHSIHPLTTAFFHLSREVRLDLTGEQKRLINSYLEVDGNRRQIQKKLMEQNKFVKLKDLTNRKLLLKNPGSNNLKSVVDYLMNEKKAEVHLRHDDDGNDIIGLFFCTEGMKQNFSKFPEILSMDGTYKLVSISLNFVLLLVVDGEGCSVIVGAGLLAGEDAEHFEWLLNCLKKCNPNASQVKSIMSDKCAKERAALSKVFPGILLYICRFHTMQIFDRTLKLKINTQKQRDAVKIILEKMIYSSSEERYMTLYGEFRATAPNSAIKYFDENWHQIRDLWCDYGMTNFNLGNLTNNRLESINQKLKEVMKKNNSLMDFIIKFFVWEESHLLQNDFKMQETYTTRPVSSLDKLPESPRELYRNLLTSEAFKMIEEHFEKCNYLTFRSINEEEKYCMLKSKTLIFKAELATCGCPFWSRMQLPCHHIFGVRMHFGLPLYDENLCHVRWRREHSIKNHRLFTESSSTPQPNSLPTLCLTRRKSKVNAVITVPEKRRSIKKITDKILEHMSLLCGDKYTSRKKLLHQFWELLKKEVDFEVVEKDLASDTQNVDRNNANNDNALAEALAGLSFDDSSNFQEDTLRGLKMPSPIKYRGRPSQMSVTTPTPRKRRPKKNAK